GAREGVGGPGGVSHRKSDHGLFRTITFCSHIDAESSWNWLLGSASMPFEISSAHDFTSLQSRRYTDYLFTPSETDVSYSEFTDDRALQPESPVLSSLNVKYV